MAESITREALALDLLNRISVSEGKKISEADRAYTLDLLKEVLSTIDGKRIIPKPGAAPVNNGGVRISRLNMSR